MLQADHGSACKHLPLSLGDQAVAIIALKGSKTKKLFGFLSETLVFGSIDSAIRYNVFSRIIAELFAHLFGAPSVSFFDDSAAIGRKIIAGNARGAISELGTFSSIRLKSANSEVGRPPTFLGLAGTFQSRPNYGMRNASLSAGKRAHLTKLIADYLK